MGVARFLRRVRGGPGLLMAALLALSGSAQAADERAEQAFKRLDHNGDGIVDFDEFVRASDERLAGMDRNGDGNIGPDEFMGFHEAAAQRRTERVFALLDANKDGRLDPGELQNRPEAKRLLACDADKDGALGRGEYLECRRRAAERWMHRIFAKYDKDGDGFIGREERVAALGDFFRRLDPNSDGKIERAEFAAAHQRWMERRGSASGNPSDRTSAPSEPDQLE